VVLGARWVIPHNSQEIHKSLRNQTSDESLIVVKMVVGSAKNFAGLLVRYHNEDTEDTIRWELQNYSLLQSLLLITESGLLKK
jgi:hypothetical protein